MPSKQTKGKVITQSAKSDDPLDDDQIRELAEDWGDDPDLLVQRHREIRDILRDRGKDDDGPMPMVFT